MSEEAVSKETGKRKSFLDSEVVAVFFNYLRCARSQKQQHSSCTFFLKANMKTQQSSCLQFLS